MSLVTPLNQQPTLSPQALKSLEQSRQRLSQLTNSLATLQRDILTSDPLPPWQSLSSLSSIIAQNLAALSAIQSEHSTLLSSVAVYPQPGIYPSSNRGGSGIPEGLLEQLLRKKLEPGVEDWVETGRERGQQEKGAGSSGGEALRGLWEWSAPTANAEARRHAWGADYTRAEVEGEGGIGAVTTGLRRKLKAPDFGDDEGDEEEDEDEEDEEEDQDEDTAMVEADGVEPLARVDVRRKSTEAGVELDIIAGSDEKEGRGNAKPITMAAHMRYLMTGNLP